MNETCLTSSGKVSKVWTFKGKAEVKLPVTSSLSSRLINCGSMCFVTRKDQDITVSPTRMEALSPSHFQEQNLWAKMNLTTTEEEDFTPSFRDDLISGSNFRLSNYICAALGGGVLAAIGASCLGYFKGNSSTTATTAAPSTIPTTRIKMNFIKRRK